MAIARIVANKGAGLYAVTLPREHDRIDKKLSVLMAQLEEFNLKVDELNADIEDDNKKITDLTKYLDIIFDGMKAGASL